MAVRFCVVIEATPNVRNQQDEFITANECGLISYEKAFSEMQNSRYQEKKESIMYEPTPRKGKVPKILQLRRRITSALGGEGIVDRKEFALCHSISSLSLDSPILYNQE